MIFLMKIQVGFYDKTKLGLQQLEYILDYKISQDPGMYNQVEHERFRGWIRTSGQ